MAPPNYTRPRTYLRRPDDIGAIIRNQRERLGLSQKEFAERLGTSRKWVNELEQGNPSAKISLVLRALSELEITVIAESGDKIEVNSPAPIDEIDIDAIADMNLQESNKPRKRRSHP